MSTYSEPAFLLDTERDVNKVKVMVLTFRKSMLSLTMTHDILGKDLKRFSLLCIMVRHHCEGSPLIEQCDSTLIKCNELVPLSSENL